MSQHDDERSPHEAKADELEHELGHMDEQHERLGDKIGDAGEEWERQKKDESVPTAVGDEEDDAGDGDGDDSGSGEELDFGRDIETEDVAGEAPEDADDSDDADDDDSDDDDDEDEGDEEGDARR